MKLFKDITIIGLTGQSGAGKSSVAGILKDLGFNIVDADKVSHRAASIEDFLEELKKSFPRCVDGGRLDRRAAAELIFGDKSAKEKYISIIFPYITRLCFEELYRLSRTSPGIVVFDAPTLFESGLDSVCEAVISVVAPYCTLVERIMARDSVSRELAVARLESQKSEEFFRASSDYLINNNLSYSELVKSTEEVALAVRERFDA